MSILEKQDLTLERTELRRELENKAAQIDKMVYTAQDMKVFSRWTAEDAMNFAVEARSLYKSIESARKEITSPARNFINHVNDTVKIFTEKLLKVEEIITDKIEAWKEEEKQLADLLPIPDSDLALKNIHSEKASSYEVTEYSFDITNIDLIPKEYLKIDEDKVTQAMKSGIQHIPGLSLKKQQKTVLRAR